MESHQLLVNWGAPDHKEAGTITPKSDDNFKYIFGLDRAMEVTIVASCIPRLNLRTYGLRLHQCASVTVHINVTSAFVNNFISSPSHPEPAMGIPNLLSTLEPFAQPARLDNRHVVIDGPALAYHILHKCTTHGFLEPSYELLRHSVVAWLNSLAQHGVTM